MTSKNSTNNISLLKLMKEDIHHKTWMIALSALASFLFGPVAFAFVMSSYRLNYNPEYSKFQHYYDYLTGPHLYFQMVVAVVGAIIVAIFTFRQIYSKRMMDLYHSAPVSRTKLFLSGYMNGFLVWFVPLFLCQLFVYLTAIISLGQGQDPALYSSLLLMFVSCIGLCILGFLIAYHASLVPVMVSGNLMNAYVNVLIYGLFVGIAYACYLGNLGAHFDTFYTTTFRTLTGPVAFLTPFATPFMFVFCANEMAFAYWKMNLLGAIVVMLLNGALAFFLYKKRPSELAERGLENKFFQHVFRIAVSLVSGMLFSLFFGLISGEQIGWSIFGALFGVILSFCILNIIYHVGFKAIFTHKLQLGVVLFIACFCVLSLYFDIFGYDHFVPTKSSIKGLSFAYNNGFSDRTAEYVLENGYIIRDSRIDMGDAFETLTFTDKDDIYNLLTAINKPKNEPRYGNIRSYRINVRIDTAYGSFYRAYEVDNTMLDVLRPFIESPEYQAENYRLQTLNLGYPKAIRLHPFDQDPFLLEDKERIKELTDAFSKDFYENNTIEKLTSDFSQLELNLQYPFRNRKGSSYGTTNFYYNVNLWNTHTIELLKEWYPEHFWSAEDLSIKEMNVNLTIPTVKTTEEKINIIHDYFAPLENQTYDWNALFFSGDENISFMTYTVTDYERINKFRPYLIPGRYDNGMGPEEYVYIGEVTTQAGSHMSCYVKRGSLPKELLETIALCAEYEESFHYVNDETDEIYFDAVEEERIY